MEKENADPQKGTRKRERWLVWATKGELVPNRVGEGLS